jgi:hypothetical protein
MTEADKSAFELAIQMMRTCGEPIWAGSIDKMLAGRGLEEAGRYASHCMQFTTLQGRPWLMLPCDLAGEDPDKVLSEPDEHGRHAAARLLQRMRNAGVSDWHPDPMAALREAEKKPAA